MTTTTTIINLPNKTLPSIPIPKDAIDANVNINIPSLLHHNSSGPAATVRVGYMEQWTGDFV